MRERQQRSVSPLSRRAFRVYKALQFYDRMGICMPEQETLRRRLKVKSLSTIERAVRELKEKGWITVRRRSQNSLIYTLLGDPARDGSRKQSKSPIVMKMELNLTGQKTGPDGSGDGSGDGSYLYSLEASPQPPFKPAADSAAVRPSPAPVSSVPEMYRGDPVAEKLWHLARRWIAETRSQTSFLDVGRIMHELEDAGALKLPAGAALPAIPFGEAKVTNRPEPKPVQSEAAQDSKAPDEGRTLAKQILRGAA